MSRTWVVIPDMQVPSEDVRSLAVFLDFLRAYRPYGLLCVGDEADSPETGRWNKGYAGEYAPTMQSNLNRTRNLMASLRVAANPEVAHTMRSNHGDRNATYIKRYAPALASLDCLEYETLLGYKETGWEFHRKPFEFERGWVLAHGDEGGLVGTAGGTALSLARKWGRSVVCGHTHKLGIQHDHDVMNSRVNRYIFGVEVGHLMDTTKASYLKGGFANWQQGFALLHVRKGHVHPQVVPIINRSFVVDGVTFQ